VVEFYKGRRDQEPGYELEVFNTVGVISVREPQFEASRQEDRLCVRSAALAVQTTI